MNSSLLFTKADTCGNSDSFACKFTDFSSTRQKTFVTILHNFTQAAKKRDQDVYSFLSFSIS